MDPPQIYTLAFLFTTFPPEVSGSAIFNWERIQWFAKQRMYKVVVLAPDWQNRASVPSVPSDLEKTLIIETYASKPWLLYKLLHVPTFSAASQISQRLTYYKPDLITVVDVERLFWFSTWHLPGSRYARKYHIPYISEYHTDYYNHLSTYPAGKWLRKIILKPLNRYLYHQCDTTLAISSAASRSLQQMGIANSLAIPLYGMDLAVYSPSRRNRKCLESWLIDQEQNNKVLLFVGRLALEKRVDLLIAAFARLKPKYNNYSLLIAGDGPEDAVNRLKRLAKPIPNIHFIGFIHGETKANVLASCDVYCSPAPYETFGRTLVEAMASGIPAVTVDSGGVSDYLIDGVNGYLVPPNKVEGLTNAIAKVLASNNTEMIQRALQDAKQFSLEQGCWNLNNYYQHLLEKNLASNPTKIQYSFN